MINVSSQNVHLRLDLAYKGTNFSGWAKQPGQRTVQGVLEDALGKIFRQTVTISVAGRTDAGVHAQGQVAHCDVPSALWQDLPGRSDTVPEIALLRRLFGVLARDRNTDVAVRRVQQVDCSFDARFCALSRRYIYKIQDQIEFADPLAEDTLIYPKGKLDVIRMAKAAQYLIGEHDFYSFSKPRAGASTVREIFQCEWKRVEQSDELGHGRSIIILNIQADAFTHSMVRSIVGASLFVGTGKREPDWFKYLLQLGQAQIPSRDPAVAVAPPQGITLLEVTYPDTVEQWVKQQELARRVRGRKSLRG